MGKEQTVSMGTLGGGIRCRYEGWDRHLEWIARPTEGYPSSNRAHTVGEGFRQTPQGEHLGFFGAASQDGLQNPTAGRGAGLDGCGFLQPETGGLRACWAGESAQ